MVKVPEILVNTPVAAPVTQLATVTSSESTATPLPSTPNSGAQPESPPKPPTSNGVVAAIGNFVAPGKLGQLSALQGQFASDIGAAGFDPATGRSAAIESAFATGGIGGALGALGKSVAGMKVVNNPQTMAKDE